MYIISKYKDFYDGVAGTFGIDKTIVYNREKNEIEFKSTPAIFHDSINKSPLWNLGSFYLKKEHRLKYELYGHFIVGFCGKLYIGWKLYSKNNKNYYSYNDIITKITYNNNYIKTILEPKSWYGMLDDDIRYVLNYNPIQIFRDFNTPVFICDYDYNRTDFTSYYNRRNPKFFINPVLKDYKFYRVFNAVQAFQEISMFIGGVLGSKEKEIIEIADKYKIAQHGFDKWSFRKEPEIKK